MKLNVYGIYDNKAKMFAHPFFLLNDAVASRMFMNLINDPNSDISKNPEDYTLSRLATWDDSQGLFERSREIIVDGYMVVNKDVKDVKDKETV